MLSIWIRFYVPYSSFSWRVAFPSGCLRHHHPVGRHHACWPNVRHRIAAVLMALTTRRYSVLLLLFRVILNENCFSENFDQTMTTYLPFGYNISQNIYESRINLFYRTSPINLSLHYFDLKNFLVELDISDGRTFERFWIQAKFLIRDL